jgi:predicted CXXCH cytochrome family protein
MRLLRTNGLLALLYCLVGILPCFAQQMGAVQQMGSVQGSMHDLSVSGTGDVKATMETRVCVFCHATHLPSSAGPGIKPLWNQQLSTVASYNQYSSTTYNQITNTPSTHSKLCLSCHDGTVGIGQTYSNPGVPISMQGSLTALSNLGTDLSNDHPFGFNLPAVDDGEIRLSLAISPPQTANPAVKLVDNKIECITCHEPHTPNLDSSVQFLAVNNSTGALCTACHDPARGSLSGWLASPHATSGSPVGSGAGLPYSSVATNACASCHSGHNTPGASSRLLRSSQTNTCATCHGAAANLNPPLPNVIAEVSSPYSHPVGLPVSPPHDPAESLPVSNSRHSECADCHNAHAAQSPGSNSPPAIPRSMTGASGIGSSGAVVSPAANEYEICFKCHSDSTNKPQSSTYTVYGREPVRATWSTDPYNLRLDFDSPVTRHNVTQPARPGVSPSLRATMLDLSDNPTGRSLQTSAYIYCSDCHNNDSARSLGGSNANGPHGSKWTHILERQYQQNAVPAQPGGDFNPIAYTSGVNNPYALCDKCHDLDNQLGLSGTGPDSIFKEHQVHVVKVGASCSVCHASHGVQGASAINNAHLVNFDTQIVGPVGTNPAPYIDTTARTCNLTCHGQAHNGTSY